MERKRPTQQIYSNYTEEDFLVWKTLFERQIEVLKLHASKDFLKALNYIGFTSDKIPDFYEVNTRLQNVTGWKLVSVPCISSPEKFFPLLSEKKFTATCWLRKLSELDYIEEPDMFHDVFAHAPLLSNIDYCIFFKTLGDIAVKHINNAEIITMLQRLYWFTIEFGLIKENEELKIYGAGIISSKSETLHSLNNKSKKHAFNVVEIMQHPFRTDIIQNEYYVIESFSQLKNSIGQIQDEIDKLIFF